MTGVRVLLLAAMPARGQWVSHDLTREKLSPRASGGGLIVMPRNAIRTFRTVVNKNIIISIQLQKMPI